jgi:hypothetical protein
LSSAKSGSIAPKNKEAPSKKAVIPAQPVTRHQEAKAMPSYPQKFDNVWYCPRCRLPGPDRYLIISSAFDEGRMYGLKQAVLTAGSVKRRSSLAK